MADASGKDLTQFERWYLQAGTPTVTASSSYDAAAKKFSLTLKQSTPATPGPLSVDRSAAFCTRRVPKDQRRLQMATWDAAVISTAKDWVTESQATLGQYDDRQRL